MHNLPGINTRDTHMTNDDFPPDAPENKPVIIPFPERKLENVKSVSWVNQSANLTYLIKFWLFFSISEG
jgi:hypothetical protein